MTKMIFICFVAPLWLSTYLSPSLTGSWLFSQQARVFRYRIAKCQGFRLQLLQSEKSKWFNSCLVCQVWELFDAFRHDVGFSADAHRHQVSLGLSFKQVGFWFTPLSFGSSPPLSRLWSWLLLTKHFPSLLCTKLFRWVSFLMYVMICFWLSALQIPWRITWNTSIFYFSWFSSWCEDRSTLGKDLALQSLLIKDKLSALTEFLLLSSSYSVSSVSSIQSHSIVQHVWSLQHPASFQFYFHFSFYLISILQNIPSILGKT